MKKVFKYRLEITGFQKIELPLNAEILTVQFQHDQLCLWALVDSDSATEEREIKISGTGHPIVNTNLKFIASVQELDGNLVWHVFEVIDKK